MIVTSSATRVPGLSTPRTLSSLSDRVPSVDYIENEQTGAELTCSTL